MGEVQVMLKIGLVAILSVWGFWLFGATVKIDFDSACGPVKPLNGVNNSPVKHVHPNGYKEDVSVQTELDEIGVPFCRLHDAVGAFGGAHYVDVGNVFPDFSADETKAENYDFAFTDAYLKSFLKTKVEIFYRLGCTIENECGVKSYNRLVPSDPQKWARVCEHIVRHYTEGWADGYRWNMRYWEIWNEPDGRGACWAGTQQQFFELYRITANHLKVCFPKLKVGGYGSVGFYSVDDPGHPTWGVGKRDTAKYAEDFLKYISHPETRAPLDFFTWHIYIRYAKSNPLRIKVHAEHCRRLLDRYGFHEAESILGEWNCLEDVNTPGVKIKDWDALKEMTCGAPIAGVLSVLQYAPVDMALYYAAQPDAKYCGLFYWPSERTTPVYEVFRVFSEFKRMGIAVKAVSDDVDVFALAAKDGGGRKAFYVVNASPSDKPAVVPVVTGASGTFEMVALDPEHAMPTSVGLWRSGEGIRLGPHAMRVFRLRSDLKGNAE